jgi:elongation factor Ts
MAEISAKLVKELRESTGAGMMDCKKALVETDGDMEKAVDLLREKGLGKAAKKADRLASEGLIQVEVASDCKSATISEINSETDFVAKNDNFIKLTKDTTSHIHSNNVKSVEELMSTTINDSKFEEYFNSQIATIGENLVLRRFATIKADEQNGIVNGYVHSTGRVGVIIAATCENAEVAKKSEEFIRQLCMHAAAMKPSFLSYKELDAEFIEKETVGMKAEIEKENEELRRLKKHEKKVPTYVSMAQLTPEVMAQAEADIKADLKAQGKPEKIWDKILPGSLARFVADNTQLDQRMTLLSQFYVMDDKKTIEQVLEEKAKEFGGKIELVEYVRFELGEGLEKKEEDFAAEVAAQLG